MPSAKKTSRRERSEREIAAVLVLHAKGYSAQEIDDEINVPKSTVTRIIRRATNSSDKWYHHKKRPGRPPALTTRAHRRLIRYVDQNPKETLLALCTPSKSGTLLSRTTTRKYLQKGERYAFRPRKKPFLKPEHKKARVRWAKIRRSWEVEDWGGICWSDEATFEVGYDATPSWVRRPKGKAYESKYLKPTFKSGRSSVGVWGCISLNFKGPLVIIPRGQKMNQHRYLNEVMIPHGIPFFETVCEAEGGAYWMDDGAKWHTTPKVIGYCERHGVVRMPWPAQSPDLNPIENVWRIMKLRISKRRHRIRSIKEMERVLQEEWDKITPADYRRCISSMPKRIDLIYKNKGSSIKY
jgi:transposase